jgi:hypothetical protein
MMEEVISEESKDRGSDRESIAKLYVSLLGAQNSKAVKGKLWNIYFLL